MRGRLRLLILVILGAGAAAGALWYTRQLDRELQGQPGYVFDVVSPVPEGPPRTAALKFVMYAALQGNTERRVPATMREVRRTAAWGDNLPTEEQFDDVIAAAAADCGISAKQWLADMEYFGGLHGRLRMGDQPMALSPFTQASAIAGGYILDGGRLYLLVAEPGACGGLEPRSGLTYAGNTVRLTPGNAEAEAILERSRATVRLAATADDDDVAAIADLLKHEDRWVRREALQALARTRDAKGIDYVKPVFQDTDPEVRYLALLTLAELGDRSIEPQLRAYLGNDEDFLHLGFPHYRAVLALGRLGFTDVRDELELMAEWHDGMLFPDEAKAVLRELKART